MSRVRPTAVPQACLLQRYAGSGAYADCYTTEIAGQATHARFVAAFYTTPLFKLERLLLGLLAGRPSTDAQATELAQDRRDAFAAWQVEARSTDELLLRAGRTRSWLMVSSLPGGATRLWFGSAVLPARSGTSGPPRLGASFHALLGFHRLYSRALLASARSRLSRSMA